MEGKAEDRQAGENADITKSLEEARFELRTLMNSIPGGVCRLVYQDGLLLEYANEGMFALMKVTAKEFAARYGSRYDRLLADNEWKELRGKIEAGRDGDIIQMEYAVHYMDGRKEWRLMQAVLLTKEGRTLLQCVITDITEVKRTYFQLEQEKQKLDALANMSGDLLFEYDIEKDAMEYTRQSEDIINDEQIGSDYCKTIRHSGYVHPEDMGRLARFCDELQAGKRHILTELRKKYKDGRYHWIEIEGVTLCDFSGMPVKVIGHTKNIDERKEKEEQLKNSLERDSLTGIYNLQVIEDKIRQRLSHPGLRLPCWLIVLDVDNFKLINEANGHLVGDAVLCMVADELKSSFQDSLLGRVGGDEFMIFVEGISKEELEERLEALNDTVRGVYEDKEKNIRISCSIGVARCTGANREFEKLFQWADYALYQIRQGGKNGYLIITAGRKGILPEEGYTRREAEEGYSREETVVHNVEELVLFVLELFDNVPDRESGLKMVCDRICSFFDIDDIVYVSIKEEYKEKKYHWSRRDKRQKEEYILQRSDRAWRYIRENFDERGMLVLRKNEIRRMPGEQVDSLLFVRSGEEDAAQGCIVFVDRKRDRNWDSEKDGLYRLAGILLNHLQKMYEREQEKSEIEFQINYDAVTGFPKYQKFISLAGQYMREHPEGRYHFVYSDFSNFQYMNELYGYTEGDKILKAFATYLRGMKEGTWFTRVTSDHFVGLLEGEDADDVKDAYLALTREFGAEMNRRYDQSSLITVSGFSSVQDVKELPSSAIDRANVARKYGKDTASTVVVVYNQTIKEKNEAEKAILANMAAALESGEFKAWLQPKVSLKSKKVVGAEALVRWQRGDGTMIYPDSFIPVFEKNGFITNVDFAVLDQILAYLRDAMEEGEQLVPISVNFSRRHNENPRFVDEILSRLAEKQIPAGLIEAEITESVFMLDLSALTNNLRRLKESGIAISIDDFGSGYSSLNLLASVDADIIKLDKKFLSYTGEDSKGPVIVKYLVRMMKRMGYKVIAEGVETEEQLSLLDHADCDMVQGYYYARPMSIPDFRKFLKEFNEAV